MASFNFLTLSLFSFFHPKGQLLRSRMCLIMKIPKILQFGKSIGLNYLHFDCIFSAFQAFLILSAMSIFFIVVEILALLGFLTYSIDQNQEYPPLTITNILMCHFLSEHNLLILKFTIFISFDLIFTSLSYVG